MRALITGVNGFIGGRLYKELAEENVVTISRQRPKNDIEIKDNSTHFNYWGDLVDLGQSGELKNILHDHKIDTVFHLAAKSTRGDALEIIRSNITALYYLLEACPKGCKFLFASSSTVYGDEASYNANEYNTLKPTSFYGSSKLTGESMVGVYTRQGKINGVSLRLVANVGRGATHGVLPDIIRKLRSDSKYLELMGNCPGSSKPYIHVNDTVRAFKTIAKTDYIRHDVYNISPDNSISIEMLAYTVMSYLNIYKKIKWNGKEFEGDNKFVNMNSRLAWRDFEWASTFTSERAIEYAIEEILEGEKVC